MYCIENEVIVIEELVILYLMDIWNIWIFVWGKIIEVYKVVFIIVRKCVKNFLLIMFYLDVYVMELME